MVLSTGTFLIVFTTLLGGMCLVVGLKFYYEHTKNNGFQKFETSRRATACAPLARCRSSG